MSVPSLAGREESRRGTAGGGRALDNVFIERLWRTVKYEEIYLKEYQSGWALEAGLTDYFAFYNQVRLHGALGYLTPADKLAAREREIFAARDQKLEQARARRKARRAAERPAGIDFAKLRRQVTIERALKHLGHLHCLHGSTAQRRGPCPVHGPSHAGSRSFSVNLEKNVFRCFCPECGATGTSWTSGPRSTGSPWPKPQSTWPKPSAWTSQAESEKTAMGKLYDEYKRIPPSNRRQAAFERTRVGSNGKAKVFSLSRRRRNNRQCHTNNLCPSTR